MSFCSKTHQLTPKYVPVTKHRSTSFSDFIRQTIISMEVLYCVGTSLFKFSALLLFHRIFGSNARFTAILWIVAFIITANNIAEIFLSIFQCNPVHKAWNLHAKGSCVNILLAACIPGAINVFCDVVTVLLPIPMIWNLHMQLSRKIQLVGIFLLSSLWVANPLPSSVLTSGLSCWLLISPFQRLHRQHLPYHHRQTTLPLRRQLGRRWSGDLGRCRKCRRYRRRQSAYDASDL